MLTCVWRCQKFAKLKTDVRFIWSEMLTRNDFIPSPAVADPNSSFPVDRSLSYEVFSKTGASRIDEKLLDQSIRASCPSSARPVLSIPRPTTLVSSQRLCNPAQWFPPSTLCIRLGGCTPPGRRLNHRCLLELSYQKQLLPSNQIASTPMRRKDSQSRWRTTRM